MSNALTNVIPQIMAQGLMVLRENCVTPRLVNRSLESRVGEFGDTVDVPYVGNATAVTVSPQAIFTNVDITTSKVQVSLNFWRQASFTLSDKEIEEAISGLMPMRASATVKALGNAVDSFLLGLYKGVWNAGGVAGTTPFASTVTAYLDARKAMNTWLAPLGDRAVILNADAEGNALGLPLFSQASQRGDQGGVINGVIGRKLGADWVMNQNVVTHSAGTGTAETTHIVVTAYAAGVSVITVRCTSGGTGLVIGDIFTINGGTQTYVVNATTTFAGTIMTISFQPSLQVAVVADQVLTYVATHVVNLLLQRDAIAWASRPMNRSKIVGLGSLFETVVDPISGLALRLEVSRQNKQTTWVWDILGGGALVRPELAARILG
jgi:hypothetical protein